MVKKLWNSIKYVLGLCGLLLILFNISYFLEFTFFKLFLIPYDSVIAKITIIVMHTAVFIVVIGIGLKSQHKNLKTVCFFKKVNGGVWCAALICSIGFTLFHFYLHFLFYSFKYSWNTDLGEPNGNFFHLIDSAIIPAVAEELLFKGLVFTILKKYYSTIVAVIIASLMFSLCHLQFIRIIPLFLFSCYTFWVYLRSGSLILPMFLHFINNILAEKPNTPTGE